MSSDAHGSLSADHDDLDGELDPKTVRRIIIFTAICAIIVFGVAIFVITMSEDAGNVVQRVQDQRDALVPALQAVFA